MGVFWLSEEQWKEGLAGLKHVLKLFHLSPQNDLWFTPKKPYMYIKYIIRGLQSNWGVDLEKDQNRLNMQVNPASPSCHLFPL